jgi:uncharacterized phiE125 gp8 family phage protein
LNSLIRVTEPTKPLFTVDQLKNVLRVSSSQSDDEYMLQAYLDAAVEWIEGVGGISVMKQQWQLNLDHFPMQYAYMIDRSLRRDYLGFPIKLPRGPLYNVDSIKYYDNTGSLVTLDPTGYQVDKNSRPPAIYPPFGGFFPTARFVPNAVQILYTTGMGIKASDGSDSPDSVKNTVKQAVRFLVAHWNENREPVPVNLSLQKMPYALETMLWAVRTHRFNWEEYYDYQHQV